MTVSSLSRAECALLAAVAALGVAAFAGPPLALPAHYHAFADQRSLFGLPDAMDVLSSLAFVLAGAVGLRLRARGLAALSCAGLLLTGAGSVWYHLQPGDTGLVWDRLGMGVAFAGLLGLAAHERVSARAGVALALLVLVLSPLAALWPLRAGDQLPWAVLQFGGAAVLAALAWRPPRPGTLRVSWGAVLALYALAKALELADQALFALTHGLLSGHSLKHLLAAGAAVPLLLALRRAGQNGGQHVPGAASAHPVPHQ